MLTHALDQCQALTGSTDIKHYKAVLAQHRKASDAAFRDNADIRTLIASRAALVDRVLQAVWPQFMASDQQDACLVAVGGYGRHELHPFSDIDLLVLLEESASEAEHHDVAGLVTFLWDIGLQVGHSVRTVQECRAAATDDITVATNLLESRLVAGTAELFNRLRDKVGPQAIWPAPEFFQAKRAEQEERHERFANMEYNLEPNIKSSPGGLRDIQTIAWITKRHYQADDISMLVPRGVLTAEEFAQLRNGESFLWQVRYGLHMLSNRPEDRLLFDHQRELARIFGFTDTNKSLAVEQFMKIYYRWTMILHSLNDMLIQQFDDAIIRACEPEKILDINNRFRVRNGYIEAKNARIFEKYPSALIEVFQILARRTSIEGIHANTQRLIRHNLHLIDDDFRQNPKIQQRFIELLRSQNKVARQLRRMNRYGVLGRFIPAFGEIVGQMQHDLFHVYTVDAHTLELIRFLRRFWYEEESKLFPIAAQIVKQLPKIELLYIAGLFHDIAKGRGGDHSELGAEDARKFCQLFRFDDADTSLVCWLVRNHLLMSAVAQRQDIQDPTVIHKFASEVNSPEYLDYLYVLTAADINATNPTLWNSWRASLLRQLYFETKRALNVGLDKPTDRQQAIAKKQEAVFAKLASMGIGREAAQAIWGQSSEDYFLRESANDIVWHAENIISHGAAVEPLIAIKATEAFSQDSATEIFIYLPDSDLLFAVIAAALEQLDLNVQDARIFTSSTDYAMDTFVVLEQNGEPIGNDPQRIAHIRETLISVLSDSRSFPETVSRRTPRQMKLFAIATKVQISTDDENRLTVIEVVTADRPGLLAVLGRIFAEFRLKLISAKIVTLGERVEDIFYVTDPQGNPITEPATCDAIKLSIIKQLDEVVQSSQ